MKPRLLIKLFFISLIWTQHFQVNLESTGQTQLTLFQSSITSLSPGDEIGIFDENGLTNYNNCNNEIGELLVGSGIWTGQQLSIVSIGSVDMCSFGGVQVSGYVAGNPLKIKIYKPSTNLEYDAQLTWSVGTGTFGDIIQSISEIQIVDPYSCENNNDVMAAFGGCENAVAALGCDFIFAGIPIYESCPITCDSCPVYGCLDESACNFNSDTDIDDGSCWYANDGCSCDDGIYAEIDECGICNGSGPELGFDCDGNCITYVDCEGTCGGDATEDNCGTCDNNIDNDCLQDCLGQWGGNAEYDNCGVCDGKDEFMDCAGTCSPSTPLGQYHESIGMEYGALIDDCNVCSGGESGHIANSNMDECGVCFGDGIPEGYCDCNGNVFDDCGVCDGDGSDCGDGGSDGDDSGENDITYEDDIQPIFNANCTSYCHSGGGNYTGGLDLTSFDNLMLGTNDNGLVVIPGYADYSILIQKLNDNPPFGEQMPLNQPPLDPSLISLISDWINAGAIGPDDSGPEEDIYGCTDSIAENYNPDATIEDGSCTYPPLGELNFSNYQVNGNGISTIDIELDCEYAVNEVEISLSGVEILDVVGIESLENEEVILSPSFILWSSTSVEIPSYSGSIMTLFFTTPSEDISLCFENSNIITTIGIEYPAILGDCAQIPAGGLLTSIELVPGWNWLSINLESDDMSLDNVFSSINGSASYLKSQNAYAEYYYGYGWWGTLENISNIEMYKLIASQEDNIIFEGTPINLSTTSIPLIAGWNWIGFLPQMSLPINVALSSIDGVGTYIKNQTIYADYFGGYGWWGTLQELEPYNGYMLSTITDGELVYPIDEITSVNLEVEQTLQRQTKSYHQYEFNGSATISINSDEIVIGERDYLIAYFNGENRGEVIAVESPFSQDFIFPLMVYGDDEFNVDVKLFSFNEQKEFDLYPQIHFYPDMVIGNAISPLELKTQSSELNIPNEFVVNPAFPNPFNPNTKIEFGLSDDTNVNVKVYDISGREITVLAEGLFSKGFHDIIWNAADQRSGIYFVSVSTQSETQTQKLILIK